jgi:hypothetical protein
LEAEMQLLWNRPAREELAMGAFFMMSWFCLPPDWTAFFLEGGPFGRLERSRCGDLLVPGSADAANSSVGEAKGQPLTNLFVLTPAPFPVKPA